MHIYKCENNGFCFGVSRAIKEAEKLKGDNIYILGEIIHNESVIKKLNERNKPVIFVLWGSFARSKKELITNHLQDTTERILEHEAEVTITHTDHIRRERGTATH